MAGRLGGKSLGGWETWILGDPIWWEGRVGLIFRLWIRGELVCFSVSGLFRELVLWEGWSGSLFRDCFENLSLGVGLGSGADTGRGVVRHSGNGVEGE